MSELYNWTVRAYDGTDYGEWSEIWNFTIEPVILLELTTDTVDFGNLAITQENDTDIGPAPFVVQNNGNIPLYGKQ